MGQKKQKTAENTALDPLYTIFEHHLMTFQDSNIDRKTFISNVIGDYFKFMRRSKLVIPTAFEQAMSEELALQVRQMLVKKIYGCLTIEDYRKGQVTHESRKRAQRAHEKLRKISATTAPRSRVSPRTRAGTNKR